MKCLPLVILVSVSFLAVVGCGNIFFRGDLGGFQRIAFHRHRRFVEAGDHPVQLAALRAARNKSSAVRTTFDGRVAAAEVEFG